MAKRRSPGLMNLVAPVSYHFCLALPATFTQPGDHLLAEPRKWVLPSWDSKGHSLHSPKALIVGSEILNWINSLWDSPFPRLPQKKVRKLEKRFSLNLCWTEWKEIPHKNHLFNRVLIGNVWFDRPRVLKTPRLGKYVSSPRDISYLSIVALMLFALTLPTFVINAREIGEWGSFRLFSLPQALLAGYERNLL